MGLVVKLQTLQQLNHFSDLFKIIVIDIGVQTQSQSNFLLQPAVLFLLLLLSITRQLSSLIISYCRQSSTLPFLNTLSLALSRKVKSIHSNVSQFINLCSYLASELIIVGWVFMHELNVSPLSLARFFLIQLPY